MLVVIMRKIGAWIGSALLIVGVACFLQLPSQFAGEKDVKKFSKKSKANLAGHPNGRETLLYQQF